jgi:hypothetical protein
MVHGTTHEQVPIRWGEHQFALQPVNGRPPYPYMVHRVEFRPLAACESLAGDARWRPLPSGSELHWRRLSLTAIDARLAVLLVGASKKEPSYADFLLEVMSAEADAWK